MGWRLRRLVKRIWPNYWWFFQDLRQDERGHLVNCRWSFAPNHGGWSDTWETSGQFTIPSRHTMLEFQTDQEHGYQLHVGCPPFALYTTFRPRGWRGTAKDRSWGIRVFSWALWWAWGQDQMEHKRGDPSGSIHFLDILFGRTDCAVTAGEPVPVSIPLPEGTYAATATPEVRVWTRPRWRWWPMRMERRSWDFDIPGGLPIPGKGENSWDCGEDAILATGSDRASIGEAIGDVVGSVLRTRERHASRDWRPGE